MDYIFALQLAHSILRPRLYLEIGCRSGTNLALAECPAIAVDPDYEISSQIRAPLRLFKQTSNEFFSRPDLSSILSPRPDLVFVDGMHLVEFALRNFANVERSATGSCVVALNNVVPRDITWTTRERRGQHWTGDVYRLIPLLRKYRPDLEIRVFDIDAQGMVFISNLDPDNHVLEDRYDDIVRDLANGEYALNSVLDIRARLEPQATSTIFPYLRDASTQRSSETEVDELEELARKHLEIIKRSCLNEIYIDNELRLLYLRSCLQGNDEYSQTAYLDIRRCKPTEFEKLRKGKEEGKFYDRRIENAGFSQTMIGRLRLDSLHESLDHVRNNCVPGDLMECGVWRGGACVFMASYLDTYRIQDRKVIVADSFDGLPPPRRAEDMFLRLDKSVHPELAVPLETVKSSFEAYDLLDDRIEFLQGWFKDTLSTPSIDRLALLRIDCDLYDSTIQCLESLYDKVSSKGIVIIDDYGCLECCRSAVHDFFSHRGQPLPQMNEIDWTGVFWVKQDREGLDS